jgi:hypothetical protein
LRGLNPTYSKDWNKDSPKEASRDSWLKKTSEGVTDKEAL